MQTELKELDKYGIDYHIVKTYPNGVRLDMCRIIRHRKRRMVLIKRGFRLAGKQGHGLFVTTSRFSQKAKDYADNQHIILVDGVKLANLMIKHNFCVSTRKTFEIKTIDTDALLEYQDE